MPSDDGECGSLLFLIPELVEVVEFKKGPYDSEVGDFASTGSAQINLVDRLPRGILKAGVGEDNFYREPLTARLYATWRF